MKNKFLLIVSIIACSLFSNKTVLAGGIPDVFGYAINVDALRGSFDPNGTIGIYNGIDKSGNPCYVMVQMTVDNSDNSFSCPPSSMCFVQNTSGLCPVMCGINTKMSNPNRTDFNSAGNFVLNYYNVSGGDGGADNNVLILSQDILQSMWGSCSYIFVRYGIDDDGNTIIVYEPYDKAGNFMDAIGTMMDTAPNLARYPMQ
jgi:hypothetical protein